MDADIEEKNRKVIPRWRDFKTTLALGELHSAIASERAITGNESLAEQLEDWHENRSLAFATDLVGSGFVLGKNDEIDEAANFILSSESHSTELQKRIARQATEPLQSTHPSVSEEIVANSGDELITQSKERVKRYRKQLRDGLRNPIKFVELAREYATLGSIHKAIRAMDTAVGLGSSNRFVLRSAARLFVHTGDIERAHLVLKRAPSLRSDPWLLAAEIAVSSLREHTSSHIRLAMSQIEDANYSSFDLSELTCAIATLEMDNANSKFARKLFRRALRSPTENSVAQAVWASRSMSGLSVEVRNYDVPRKYEALAWSQFTQGILDTALEHGKNWIRDQPFAVSPVTFTGMIATLMDDFDQGETVYNFGLRANPDNATLRNNLAFALASNNEPDLAEVELNRIEKAGLTVPERIVVTATEGLIRFRQGLPDEGRFLYRCAIKLAQENHEINYVVRALVFLAREEIHARTDRAISALETAEREGKDLHAAQDLKILFSRLRATVKSNPEAFRG